MQTLNEIRSCGRLRSGRSSHPSAGGTGESPGYRFEVSNSITGKKGKYYFRVKRSTGGLSPAPLGLPGATAVSESAGGPKHSGRA